MKKLLILGILLAGACSKPAKIIYSINVENGPICKCYFQMEDQKEGTKVTFLDSCHLWRVGDSVTFKPFRSQPR